MTSVEALPSVSVVIPAFNREKTLQRAIDSVRTQTFGNWEIVVIDDGSSDGTWDVISRNAVRDPRIRGFRRELNSGLPAVARNVGMAKARGETIAFLDSDDWWWPHHLSRHVQGMKSCVSRAMSFSHLWTRRRGRPGWGLLFLPGTAHQSGTFDQLVRRNSIQCSGVVIRTQVVNDLGGFNEDPRLRAVEDYELWLRVSMKNRIEFIEGLTGVYNDNGGISQSEDMELRLADLSKLFGIGIERRSQIQRMIERSLTFPSAAKSAIAGSFSRGGIQDS